MVLSVGVSPLQRIAMQQNLGQGLIGQGLGGGPTTPLGGVANIAQTLAGAFLMNKANTASQARQTAANKALLALAGGGAPAGGGVATGAMGAFAGGPPSVASPFSPAGRAAAPVGPVGVAVPAGGGPGGASVAQIAQTLQQFPELASVLNPLLAQRLTPQKPTVIPTGGTAIDASGRVIARGAPKRPEFKTDLGKATSDLALAKKTFGENSPQAKAFAEAVASERAGGGVDLTDEGGQRKEFTKASGDFIKVRDAFGKIQAARPTAAGDLALIFNYMKLLDPGSVVREGEFATAQNTAGVPDRIRNTYNQLRAGERLSDRQRASFKTQAGDVFSSQMTQQNLLEGEFRKVAQRSGLRPDNVVIDFQGDLRDFTPTGDASSPSQPQPEISAGTPLIGGAAASAPDRGVIAADTSKMTLEELEAWNAEMDRRGL